MTVADHGRAELTISEGQLTSALVETVDRIAGRFAGVPGALLPILHALQHELGYIDERAVPLIALALNLSRAEVHGVVSFYHDFRSHPAPAHVVKLCRAEACQARGAVAIEQAIAERLNVEMGATSVDGRLALEPVYCLGLCATGPNALVDGVPMSRLDVASIDRIATKVAA